jgi:Arc/MetJ family transcription regulator
MRTTLELDDELSERAKAYTGLTKKSAVVREALRALVERESVRRLAALGGSHSDAKEPPVADRNQDDPGRYFGGRSSPESEDAGFQPGVPPALREHARGEDAPYSAAALAGTGAPRAAVAARTSGIRSRPYARASSSGSKPRIRKVVTPRSQ